MSSYDPYDPNNTAGRDGAQSSDPYGQQGFDQHMVEAGGDESRIAISAFTQEMAGIGNQFGRKVLSPDGLVQCSFGFVHHEISLGVIPLIKSKSIVCSSDFYNLIASSE